MKGDMKSEDSMGTGSDFDLKFGQSMVEDHKKDIEEATTARDNTSDPKLKKLLDGMLPVLKKHQDTAQKVVDSASKAGPTKS
jgi:predicted outer membrane protein